MRILRTAGLMLLAIVLAGALYQWFAAAADRAAYPAPGRRVAVDGLAMHLDCRGAGEPVVVLEAGLTSGSASWGLVQESMARVTRVCAYDRPGIDWSEPIGRTADAAEVAGRLHRLLAVANVDGPYLLVGMSAGGVYVREYFRSWPEDVVGMVLVDSSHEQQGRRLPEIEAEAGLDGLLRLCTWLQPVGVIRAFSLLDALLEPYDLPSEVSGPIRANVYQSHACGSIRAELRSFVGDVDAAEPPASLGDLPLIVISQGKEPEAGFGMTAPEARELRKVWDVLQEELAALSTRGRRIVATRSGHVVQFEQPELVIDAVGALALELREGG